MKKIKNVKYRVELSYKNSFVFNELSHAGYFMRMAVTHAEDPEDIERFEISPIVEYEDETEPVIYFDDNITEADKMEIKQKLNSEFGVATSIKEEENEGQ